MRYHTLDADDQLSGTQEIQVQIVRSGHQSFEVAGDLVAASDLTLEVNIGNEHNGAIEIKFLWDIVAVLRLKILF